MDRFKFSLKVGILSLLLFCTLNYLVPMPDDFIMIIIYSLVYVALLMFLIYIFLPLKTTKRRKNKL
ncbi:hypothetical protein CD148_12915 [Staphylococcus delphini]|uniref:Mobilization protein n=1 Tax=Staphylococcus delphini TaxID=53344 RepID=A0AAX0QQH6_9STAP|nr:hypothetical protein B5C07_12670 [Staphylococcus delphini]PNZ88284.1 hypothetical protein CD148_12915 [Staphylococcus delphini]RIZ49084.1 hypothetical protein CDL68_12365 [Staphylococcus delphini]